jgi:hypothetical protein
MPRPRNDQFTKTLFYFIRCDPQKGPLTEFGKEGEWKLNFEAHINSINDTSSPSWETSFDMGRPDPKVFYQSVNRNVSVNFKIVAFNEQEHRDNHVLMAKLGILTYPIYKAGAGYNGPHVFYCIGQLMKGYGVITSLDYSWDNETPWIEGRPLYTDVNISIMKLADGDGKRPSVESKYFI